jgi:hypothetical protein
VYFAIYRKKFFIFVVIKYIIMKKTELELEDLHKKILQCKYVIGISFEDAGTNIEPSNEIEIDIDKSIDEDSLSDLLNNIRLFNSKQNNITLTHCIR